LKFKKLSLLGFKSFANKLEVKFGEGITAIVGPNGCGKSNIADAVRWVLGEQSAKLLRGDNMRDVIFKGSEKRSALSYAEVSLTFDNKNKSLFPSYDYEEAVISRKLFRSNESEYYRNGNPCLLRDISEMLRDAGFAREGYTIIGQGKVTELIHSKPEDRRAIFEEAAGISKYKFKKNEAERKNARTRENLMRIDDAMAGDLARLEPLAKQAEKTRQWRELKERLKYHEINFYINQYETAADTKDKLSAVINGIDAQIAAKQSEYESATEEYNTAREKLRTLDEDIEAYRNELMDLSVDKEKVAGQIQLVTQQLNSLNAQIDSLTTANYELGNNYNSLTITAEQKQGECNKKAEELQAVTEEFAKLNSAYTEVANRVAEEEEKIERAQKALINAMERRMAVSMSIGELTSERASLTDRLEVLKAQLSEYTDRICSDEGALSALADELTSLAAEKDGLCGEKTETAKLYTECSERLKTLVSELSDAKQEYSATESRRKTLADVRASMEGYAYSVRKLLADAKTDGRIGRALMGVVGQILNVKEGFETAIEMALGSAVNNIVTKDEDDAKLLIGYLKEKRYGRATFLPITGFKSRSLDPALLSLVGRYSGCYGIASDAVTYDSAFETIVSGLLGGTVIVDNMDTAVALAKESNYGFRIVTLDGDVIYQHGSITGGSKKTDATSVFSHERELKEMTATVSELKSRIERLQQEHDALSTKADDCNKRVRALTEDIHEYEVAEAAKSIEYNKLADELQSLKQNKAAAETMIGGITERLEVIAGDIAAIEQSQDELTPENGNEETERVRKELEAMRAERDKLHDEVTVKNLRKVTLQMDIDNLKSEISRLKSEAVSTQQRIENNNMAILGNNRAIEVNEAEIRKLTESHSGGNEVRRNELRATLDDLSDYKARLNEKVVETDQARVQFSDECSKLTEQKHMQELLLTRVDSDMDAMQSRVSEEYGLCYDECLPYKDENYDPESGNVEIMKLKRRISNLGSINENAIEESKELSAVYHEKELQREDLAKSLADEERIIKEMSDTMLRDFNVCFEKIRTNFREIFVNLFNGGAADLVLTENEDPLLRGVEIMAQPPSKGLLSISLLSGGEQTLTAIAILFAILKLRPMPFCLLDEIDAALDDANVGRFASYLKNFSAQTQFIVITHRKPTMEQADCLYGVTMEEKGVSKIVSVKLQDAVANATAAND